MGQLESGSPVHQPPDHYFRQKCVFPFLLMYCRRSLANLLTSYQQTTTILYHLLRISNNSRTINPPIMAPPLTERCPGRSIPNGVLMVEEHRSRETKMWVQVPPGVAHFFFFWRKGEQSQVVLLSCLALFDESLYHVHTYVALTLVSRCFNYLSLLQAELKFPHLSGSIEILALLCIALFNPQQLTASVA